MANGDGTFTWIDRAFLVLSFKTNRALLSTLPFIGFMTFVSVAYENSLTEMLKDTEAQIAGLISSCLVFCTLTFFYHFGMYVRRNWDERAYLRYSISGTILFWIIVIPYSLIFYVYDSSDREFWFIFLLLPVTIYCAVELYFRKIK